MEEGGGNDAPRAASVLDEVRAVAAEVEDRPLYDEDFYAWTGDQARLLRAQARLRTNEPGPRQAWQSALVAIRIDLEDKLTLSIERRLRHDLERHDGKALRRLRPQLEHHEPDMLQKLPATCPKSFAQILGADDRLPEPGTT